MKKLIIILALTVILSSISTAQQGEAMDIPDPLYYLVELHGTRDTWPDDMTADEGKIMEEHFAYLKGLTVQGKVLMAGPVFGKFGLIVLKVYSEDAAKEIMSQEPSVVKGVHTYQMTEMRASLMARNIPPYIFPDVVSDKAIHKEVEVNASIADVWHAWTTTDGVKTFFSPYANVELGVGGPFEIYFLPDQPYGSRGSENCKILAYLPEKMLSFEWNGPPQFGQLRYIKTQVNILFEEIEPGKVKLDFTHHGWGTGEDWDKLYEYFDSAWGYVLGNFKKRFDEGPLDWGY